MRRLKIKIMQDDSPPNPREDFDPLDTMICFHKRYTLGDKHDYKCGDFNSWQAVIDHIKETEDVVEYLPLYMYDHSGLTISTSPFSCPWDSGQVGWIYLTREQVKERWGWDEVTDEQRKRCLDALRSSVEVYDQYLAGDVWVYQIIEECPTCGHDTEVVDCVGGFYGRDVCEEEAKAALEYLQNQDAEMAGQCDAICSTQ